MFELGNVAEIVAAAGTVAATAAAFWAAYKASAAARATQQTLALERGRDQRQLEEATQAQARTVSAWIELTVPIRELDPSGRRVWWEADLVVQNGSTEPIYEVAALLHLGDRPLLHELLQYPVVPPGSARRHGLVPWNTRDGRDLGEDDGDLGVRPTPVQPNVEAMQVRLAFRDSANRRWIRTSTGLLESTGWTRSDDAVRDHPAASARRWDATSPEDGLRPAANRRTNC